MILLGAPARTTALWARRARPLAATALLSSVSIRNWSGGFQFVSSLPISERLATAALPSALDGLSLIMVLLTAIVTLRRRLVYRRNHRSTRTRSTPAFCSSPAGAMGAFASLDLFFFYAFHELALIPTFLLIGIWGSGERQAAAWKITIYLATWQLHSPARLDPALSQRARSSAHLRFSRTANSCRRRQIPADAQRNIFLLLLIGFGILVSLFPFHTWAPEAYASAPAPAAMLHAGVLKKFGLYGLLRLALPLLPRARSTGTRLLLVLLLGNIIYVGLVTIAQKRLDWMLGYSSVMHMGYIFLGIASGNIARHERRGAADVRARPFHRACSSPSPAKCGNAPGRSLSTISAVSGKSCRCARSPLASPRLLPSVCRVSPTSPAK